VAECVVIRPERDADHPVIAEVVRAAFVGHPDEVASFVERIRASEQFIPELALVAEDSSGVIAHVMLSWVGVEGGSRTRILNLTPMSVRPDRQRIGVGARLIRDALGHAEEAGEPAVIRQIEPDTSACYGHEPGEARLELMLPLLLEPEALVPRNGTTRVLYVENRNDLLIHSGEPKRRVPGGARLACASVRE
jgi:putative acetyltransferase